MLATITVNSLLDNFNVNTPATDGLVTLREAVLAANTNTTVGDASGGSSGIDTIDFSVSGEIDLAFGEIEITESLAIDASGSVDGVTIDADQSTGVLHFSASSGDLTLNNVTLTRGFNLPSGGGISFNSTGQLELVDSVVSGNRSNADGGGIFSLGNVNLIRSSVVDNLAQSTYSYGGGIRVIGIGNVSLTDSMVSDNTASSNRSRGGGISTNSGDVVLTNSTVTGNRTTAIQEAWGGGIHTQDGDVTLFNSVVSNNYAKNHGGGIITSTGDVKLTRSTISGNEAGELGGGIVASKNTRLRAVAIYDSTVSENLAGEAGGGIFVNSGFIFAENSTISGNSATQEGGGIRSSSGSIHLSNSTVTENTTDGVGGGVLIDRDLGNPELRIRNSIVAGNSDNGTAPDLRHPNPVPSRLSVDYSLIGNTTGSGITAGFGAGSLLNIAPQIEPLAENGGPTQTHALSSSSPALDAGDPNFVTTQLPSDQRGAPFSRDDGNGVDMGAYERQTLAPSFFVVNTTVDELDYSNADVSLREAISSANFNIGSAGNTITFSSLFDTPQEIKLAAELPRIVADLTITGPGADLLTIDAGHGADNQPNTQDGFRLLNINDRVDNTVVDVTVSGVTLTGGDTTGGGGAIENSESLQLIDSVVTGNSAGTGGGIYNGGELVLTRSTISGNRAGSGGGITSFGSLNGETTTLAIDSSTLSNNEARGDGGALTIDTINYLTIKDSTVSGNKSGGSGGGLATRASTAFITGSTFSDNEAGYEVPYGDGGAIWSNDKLMGQVLTIANSTLTGNSAKRGGALFSFNGHSNIQSSTIYQNSTQAGGAIRHIQGSTTSLTSTIVANGTMGGDLDGSFSGSFNLIEDGSSLSSFTNSIMGAPLLGPLADNGGPTQTHALLPGSPALSQGIVVAEPPVVLELDDYSIDVFSGPNPSYNLATSFGSPPLQGPTVSGGVVNLNVGMADASTYIWNGGEKLDSVGDQVSVELDFSTPLDQGNRSAGVGLWTQVDGGTLLAVIRAATDDGDYTFLRDDVNFGPIIGSPTEPMLLRVDVLEVGVSTMTIRTRLTADGITPIEITRTINATEAFFGPSAFNTVANEISHDNLIFTAFTPTPFDQRGLARDVNGVDIGAYEAQTAPSADFDSDGDVDGADFLAWQRGFGTFDATRADGNSDDDTDSDASDLAAWQVSYGTTTVVTTLIDATTGNGQFALDNVGDATSIGGGSEPLNVDLNRDRAFRAIGNTSGRGLSISDWEITRDTYTSNNSALGVDGNYGFAPSAGTGPGETGQLFVNSGSITAKSSPIAYSFSAGDLINLRYLLGSDTNGATETAFADATLIFDAGLTSEFTHSFAQASGTGTTVGPNTQQEGHYVLTENASTLTLLFLLEGGNDTPGIRGLIDDVALSVSRLQLPASSQLAASTEGSGQTLAATVIAPQVAPPTSPTVNTDFIDAAIALEWLGHEVEEESAAIAEQSISEAAFALELPSQELLPTVGSHLESEMKDLIVNEESKADDQAWLSDGLLELVFG